MPPPSPAPPDTCLLYLVRHAATENNLARPPRLQGRRDNSGLSEQGKLQAEQAARLLAARPIAAVFSSPLRRAVETAQAIARPHGVDVQTVDELIEVDVGDWEGMTWEQVASEDPQRHRLFVEHPDQHGYRGGENLEQVRRRAGPALERLMREHPGREIVAVSHNVVNRVYLAQLLGVPLAKARGIDQSNAGVNVIRWRNGRAKLRTMNAAFHLVDPD